MQKINFRSLFVFFLLTGMFVGQVLPLDSSLGLFEREEVRESTMSESKTDKTDATPLHPVYLVATNTWLVSPHQDGQHILSTQLVAACSTYSDSHAPRGPPFTA